VKSALANLFIVMEDGNEEQQRGQKFIIEKIKET
jgi:hypothetical protein